MRQLWVLLHYRAPIIVAKSLKILITIPFFIRIFNSGASYEQHGSRFGQHLSTRHRALQQQRGYDQAPRLLSMGALCIVRPSSVLLHATHALEEMGRRSHQGPSVWPTNGGINQVSEAWQHANWQIEYTLDGGGGGAYYQYTPYHDWSHAIESIVGAHLVFAELLNLINLCIQIYWTHRFLGRQFLTLGIKVLRERWVDKMDALDMVFPKVTKCTFYKYGAAGSLQQHDTLCVMALNIMNEKIYTILWFWYSFLFSVTVLGLFGDSNALLLQKVSSFGINF